MGIVNVLIACEKSQVYLSEFMKYPSFSPVSIDIQDTDGFYRSRHIVGDVSDYLYGDVRALAADGTPLDVPQWDIIVAFPPCTYLTNAGARWFNVDRYGELALERLRLRDIAAEFVLKIWNACPNVMIENPRGYVNKILGRPNFEGHPFQFGESFRKRTCLWFKGKGMPSSISPHLPCRDPGLDAPTYVGADGYLKRRSFVLDNVDADVRSRSFKGMASCVVAAIVDSYLRRG